MTYGDMCEVIAGDWNREQDILIGEDNDPTYLTGKDVWDMDLVGQFPALYVPMLYEAAKEEQLIGLLLTDESCSGMFLRYLSRKEK